MHKILYNKSINPSYKTTIYLLTLYRLDVLPAAIHKDTKRKIRTTFFLSHTVDEVCCVFHIHSSVFLEPCLESIKLPLMYIQPSKKV